jgi:hypothetical protein
MCCDSEVKNIPYDAALNPSRIAHLANQEVGQSLLMSRQRKLRAHFPYLHSGRPCKTICKDVGHVQPVHEKRTVSGWRYVRAPLKGTFRWESWLSGTAAYCSTAMDNGAVSAHRTDTVM